MDFKHNMYCKRILLKDLDSLLDEAEHVANNGKGRHLDCDVIPAADSKSKPNIAADLNENVR